ncbi:glycoside hydrolase family 3 N-terminal domain-containing protein [Endozoicomonas sp.]|uniref:glycoside hydrolase family 3 protein n=1 Tax=Endozoicomonas sp. TaxID=1892382 RepID=UPI003AF65A0B
MKHTLLRVAPLAFAIALAGCDSDSNDDNSQSFTQPAISTQTKPLLSVSGYSFKDSNNNGTLEPYEDWRLSSTERAEDLTSRMTLEEKSGMLLIDTLNADFGGDVSNLAYQYIEQEKMTRFIFRNAIVDNPQPSDGNGSPMAGAQITAREAAEFMNQVQQLAEETRLGIPLLFKSNARNHIDPDARAGINVSAGSFSSWPKEAGLAATGDMELIKEFAETMRSEWTAVGIRSMYGYMMDLATEPRWYRVHETFTEDAVLASNILYSIVEGLQGKRLDKDSVALTIKHFPGGGPQEGGADPHYDFGKNQIYPAGMFDYHMKPFKAAIDAGATSIMPYYGIPVDQGYGIQLEGEDQPRDVGMAFSKGIVSDLLRGELGFTGYVNSDTGIIGDRAWGLEDLTVEEQIVLSIDAGTDVLSGFHENATIKGLVDKMLVAEERIDLSVKRLLKEQFELGLFENPYVDPDHAETLIASKELQKKADLAQRKSIVLLQNQNQTLPLPEPVATPTTLYTMGMDAAVAGDPQWGFSVIDGSYDAEQSEQRPAANSADYALIRVSVSNEGADPNLYFGGANPDELDYLAFSDMVGKHSWKISPSLADIQAVMNEVGAENTILSIYFRYPFVLDDASGMKNAGAILATYGVTDPAIMDVVSGQFNPQGKLPISLANNARAIVDQAPDAPGYAEEDTLFPFGHGLSYEANAETSH